MRYAPAMPIRQFILVDAGSAGVQELDIPEQGAGWEQTCLTCGIIIARVNPDGTNHEAGNRATTDIRFTLIVPGTGAVTTQISTELCELCSAVIFEPFAALLADRGLKLPAPDVDGIGAKLVDAHLTRWRQRDELTETEPGADDPGQAGLAIPPVNGASGAVG